MFLVVLVPYDENLIEALHDFNPNSGGGSSKGPPRQWVVLTFASLNLWARSHLRLALVASDVLAALGWRPGLRAGN